MAEPEAEHGEMQPGYYITERLVRNRRPPSTLNYATLGNPYVSSLQASNATQPYRFSLHFQYRYLQFYSLKFHLFQQLRLHSTVSHHHSLQHYLFSSNLFQSLPLTLYLHFGLIRDIITQATDMVTQCCLQAKYSYKSFYHVALLKKKTLVEKKLTNIATCLVTYGYVFPKIHIVSW